MAAAPEATASPATPPSRAATRCSKACLLYTSNLSSVIENLIIDYVLKRFPSVAICGDKMEQNPYTQLDYMDDLYYYMSVSYTHLFHLGNAVIRY